MKAQGDCSIVGNFSIVLQYIYLFFFYYYNVCYLLKYENSIINVHLNTVASDFKLTSLIHRR